MSDQKDTDENKIPENVKEMPANQPRPFGSEEDEENPTLVEKFTRLEMETKTGLLVCLSFFLALIFRWHWFNTRWWVVLVLGVIGLKTLYTQMNDLVDDKPSEAKLARYSFIGLIALLVIRDLYITAELADFLSLMSIR